MEDEEASYENSARNRQMITLNLGSTKSKLTIECMTPDQAGEYSCVADIPKDRIAASTQVEVGEFIILKDFYFSNMRQNLYIFSTEYPLTNRWTCVNGGFSLKNLFYFFFQDIVR